MKSHGATQGSHGKTDVAYPLFSRDGSFKALHVELLCVLASSLATFALTLWALTKLMGDPGSGVLVD
jgi:hypothetical protein